MPSAIEVCAVGLKGVAFVESLLNRTVPIDSITSYRQPDDLADGFERLRKLAEQHSIEFRDTRHPEVRPENLVFLVGWQHLLHQPTQSTVVFHDSLLPRYRGFAPTVAALIKGDSEIGVTAILPGKAVDQGPIITQKARPISYPMKIAEALAIQAELMAELAAEIVGWWRQGQLPQAMQKEELATYSIWRDDADYEVDWFGTAVEIERFVNAVGYPYAGARTSVGNLHRIRIIDVTALPDLRFEIRHIGKIWKLDEGRPVVICGTGMLRIDRCQSEDGSPFVFRHVRSRLGAA
jgi:methionyl-tRNA formyltransferase